MQALSGCTEVSEQFLEESFSKGADALSRQDFRTANRLFKYLLTLNLDPQRNLRAIHGRADAYFGLENFKYAKFFYKKTLPLIRSNHGNTEVVDRKLKFIAEQLESWGRKQLPSCCDNLQYFAGAGYDEGYEIVLGITEGPEFEGNFPLFGPPNRSDDRYSDIIPCAKTIVDFNPPCLGQYINANFIDIDGLSMIATQYPLKHTGELFWKMALQKNCKVILNFAKSVEIFDHDFYFPQELNEAMTIGPYKVTMVKQEIRDSYNINYLCLETEGNKYDFVQIHCTVWPDQGVPDSPEVLVQVLEELINTLKLPGFNNSDVRPLFHCKAGAGRTGVAMLLYVAMTARMRGVGEFNLCSKLIEMRQSRRCLVQNAEQYQYVINCLKHLISKDNK